MVSCWGIIADKLSRSGWSFGYVSAVDSNGRTIWIANAPSRQGKAVRCARGGVEKLTAFLELEAAIHSGPARETTIPVSILVSGL